jgi:hypothetical protein
MMMTIKVMTGGGGGYGDDDLIEDFIMRA